MQQKEKSKYRNASRSGSCDDVLQLGWILVDDASNFRAIGCDLCNDGQRCEWHTKL
ncbi:hypothetical protein GYH30_028382 [Glycine max]|nr:hypothetical protein JHK86_028653 [Glycine max]KAH1138908.1 hypothetical protein GYH30_028382 [Glycine max]